MSIFFIGYKAFLFIMDTKTKKYNFISSISDIISIVDPKNKKNLILE